MTDNGSSPDSVEQTSLTQSDIRSLFKRHGGGFHGPRVEHANIEEQAFYRFVAEVVLNERRAAIAALCASQPATPTGPRPEYIRHRNKITSISNPAGGEVDRYAVDDPWCRSAQSSAGIEGLPRHSAMKTALGYMRSQAAELEKLATTVSGSGEGAEIYRDAAMCIEFAMHGVAQASSTPYAEWRESIGIVLYNCEKFRAVHAGEVLSAAAGKQITGADMEPWEECSETFLSDADAVIDFLRTTTMPSKEVQASPPAPPPQGLIKGAVYHLASDGPSEYLGVDVYHGEATHHFKTAYGSRYIKPEHLSDRLALSSTTRDTPESKS